MTSRIFGSIDIDRTVWDPEYRKKVMGYLMRSAVPSSEGVSSNSRKYNLAMDFENAFKIAFQPIVDTATGRVFAHEALARTANGESAGYLLDLLSDAEDCYQFDHLCRVKAIHDAARLNMDTCLSINLLPGAIGRPGYGIEAAIKAAREVGFPIERLIFELSEREYLENRLAVAKQVEQCLAEGIRIAIDDFGAGHAGLGLLVDVPANLLKLDMSLVRNIDSDTTRRTVAASLVHMSRELSIDVVAEGIETHAEMAALQSVGIHLMQGFLFGKPTTDVLAKPVTPERVGGPRL